MVFGRIEVDTVVVQLVANRITVDVPPDAVLKLLATTVDEDQIALRCEQWVSQGEIPDAAIQKILHCRRYHGASVPGAATFLAFREDQFLKHSFPDAFPDGDTRDAETEDVVLPFEAEKSGVEVLDVIGFRLRTAC